jgi:hypothetical protein
MSDLLPHSEFCVGMTDVGREYVNALSDRSQEVLDATAA